MARTSQEHLIVDGFNVLHQHPALQPLLRRGVAAGVAALTDLARRIHDFEGIRVTVVLDGRGDSVQVERPCGRPTFSLLYAPAALSADGLIEQLVERAGEPSRVTVVTEDNLVREAAMARGSTVLDAVGFEARAERCGRFQSEWIGRQRRKGSWGSLGDLFSGDAEK